MRLEPVLYEELYVKTGQGMLNISDIQRFSLGDGGGIRTTVFLKGCNMRCPWCHNPETWSDKPQTIRYAKAGVEKLCGHLMSSQEVVDVVRRDKAFFDESKGGVTISGGEAMLQADGVADLCRDLIRANISTIVDTAGCVPYSEFEKVENLADEFYYDFKTASREDYARLGGNYDLILDNLTRLLKKRKRVRIRIPLIENFNTAEENIKKSCKILEKIKTEYLDLLPFHRLGSGKYEALGIRYQYADVPSMTKERAMEIAEIYKKYFINVKVEF